MGYANPLLKLPANQAMLALPPAERKAIEAVRRDLRAQANTAADLAWRRRLACKRNAPANAYVN